MFTHWDVLRVLRLRIPNTTLHALISALHAGMKAVADATQSASVPRQVLNAAWTFEAIRFALYPEVSCFDTIANTNNHRRYVMTHRSVDAEGKNIVASQAILQDQTRRTMISYFGYLLPLILSLAAL